MGEGFKIDSKLTLRIVTAPVEGALLFTYLLHQLTAALRAANAGLDLEGGGMSAFRIAAAGEKLPVAADFDDQGLTALGAGFLGQLISQLYLSMSSEALSRLFSKGV